MLAALFTSRAGNISNSTAGINYKSESLRRRPDPQPSRVVSVEEEIVVERHASVGNAARAEMAAGEKVLFVAVVVALLEKQGQNHGVASTSRVVDKCN